MNPQVISNKRQNGFIDTSLDLGAAIRAARQSASLRVVDAALLAGISIQTMVDIEAGRPTVGIGKIMQAADALGVSLFAVPAQDRQHIRNLIAHAATLEREA